MLNDLPTDLKRIVTLRAGVLASCSLRLVSREWRDIIDECRDRWRDTPICDLIEAVKNDVRDYCVLRHVAEPGGKVSVVVSPLDFSFEIGDWRRASFYGYSELPFALTSASRTSWFSRTNNSVERKQANEIARAYITNLWEVAKYTIKRKIVSRCLAPLAHPPPGLGIEATMAIANPIANVFNTKVIVMTVTLRSRDGTRHRIDRELRTINTQTLRQAFDGYWSRDGPRSAAWEASHFSALEVVCSPHDVACALNDVQCDALRF